MFARHKWISGLMLAALALAVGAGALAFSRPAEAAPVAAATAADAGGRGRGFCGQAGLEAAADLLGLTPDELRLQLWAGESLADLAEEKGVALTDLQAAVKEACLQAQRDRIEAAVTAGNLSREKADWLLEGLDKGFWGGAAGGIGFGGGRHGGRFGGPGHFDRPEAVPATPGTGG
jgi:hypothetical protein